MCQAAISTENYEDFKRAYPLSGLSLNEFKLQQIAAIAMKFRPTLGKYGSSRLLGRVKIFLANHSFPDLLAALASDIPDERLWGEKDLPRAIRRPTKLEKAAAEIHTQYVGDALKQARAMDRAGYRPRSYPSYEDLYNKDPETFCGYMSKCARKIKIWSLANQVHTGKEKVQGKLRR